MNCKYWIGTVFFLALCLQLAAQRPRYQPQVHEWGVQLYSGRFVTDYLDYYSEGTFLNHNPLNGLRYKYHLNVNSAIRTGLFYRAGRFAADVPAASPNTFPKMSASWLGSELSLGYERKIHLHKVQLYAGIDGLISVGRARERVLEGDMLIFDSSQPVMAYGLGVAAGIRYFFNKNTSISIENGGYYMLSTRQASLPGESPHLPLEIMSGSEAGWNLFSVYISWHFKKMRKSCTCGKPGS